MDEIERTDRTRAHRFVWVCAFSDVARWWRSDLPALRESEGTRDQRRRPQKGTKDLPEGTYKDKFLMNLTLSVVTDEYGYKYCSSELSMGPRVGCVRWKKNDNVLRKSSTSKRFTLTSHDPPYSWLRCSPSELG